MSTIFNLIVIKYQYSWSIAELPYNFLLQRKSPNLINLEATLGLSWVAYDDGVDVNVGWLLGDIDLTLFI